MFCVASGLAAQIYGPGQFSIDGLPVACGSLPTIVTSDFNDAGHFTGKAIYVNPNVLGRLPTVLKLYIYAHECGHAVVGASESAADCWAITTGRNQRWFPPQAFQALIQLFNGNPGDYTHLPGPARVQAMAVCYSQP